MAPAIFTDLIINLETMGLLDVILPFLLFFTIMFAILQKTKVLGSTKKQIKTKKGGEKEVAVPHKNFNVVIALVIALMIVVPHVSYNPGSTSAQLPNGWPDPVVVVNKSLPQISVFVVAIIMMMLLIGIVGPSINIWGSPLTSWMAGISFIVVIGIFVMSLLDGVPAFLLGFEEYLPILVIIFVFGLIVYFITKEPSTETLKVKGKRWSKHLTEGEERKKEKK